MPRDVDDFGTSLPGRVWRSSTVLVLGALLGVLFILAAGAFQYWIEGRAISTQVSLEQGASSTVTVAADQVDPANEGKLVHLTGEATTKEKLTDPDFGISTQALRLIREVELYQWKETKSEVKKDSKKIVTYKYTQVWSKDKPGKGFAEPAGHVNPPEIPYANSKQDAKEVKLGAFALSHKQVDRLPADEILPITGEMVSQSPASLKGLLAADPEGYLFVGSQPGHTPDAPQVGDVRIRYKVAKPQTITVVAKQTQGGFEPFTPEGGEHVDLLKQGSHGVQALFEGAQSTNQLVGWVTRVFTVLLMTLGLFFVVRLWKNVGREKTGGGLYDFGLFFLALGFAIPLTVAVVGSRWVLHQPSVGGGLLGGGIVATVGLVFLARNRKQVPAAKEPESVIRYQGIGDEVVLTGGAAKPDHVDIVLERIAEEKPDPKKDH